MCYKDANGNPVQIGDEVSLGTSVGWVIKYFQEYALATEVVLASEEIVDNKLITVTITALLQEVTKV